ncbi:hypothetical protein BpHYR1_035073 [Brachionus plicatilis]|uniref:SWIM-type domain-containing protein n=1 Tax=Brachionus plicatilis TaxID=10195 RepID=A0A3M7SZ83_BRAPC|nr:hypothetical protein BpHYR1_035073 [Brachionus plicatilis]
MLPENLKYKGMIKTASSSHKRCFICRVSKPKWPLRRLIKPSRSISMMLNSILERKIVFIKYVALLNEWRSIKSYFCNCMSGRKVVGCCVHVTTALCFLAFDRFRKIKIKGNHLKKIFIDTESNGKTNEPNYVRVERKKKGKFD